MSQQLGLQEVFLQDEIVNPKIDIVFIHSLNGHAFGSWRSHYQSLEKEDRHIPSCRILSFGYDSEIIKASDNDELLAAQRIAGDLVDQLSERTANGTITKPLILVGASMGGLIAIETLQILERSRRFGENRLLFYDTSAQKWLHVREKECLGLSKYRDAESLRTEIHEKLPAGRKWYHTLIHEIHSLYYQILCISIAGNYRPSYLLSGPASDSAEAYESSIMWFKYVHQPRNPGREAASPEHISWLRNKIFVHPSAIVFVFVSCVYAWRLRYYYEEHVSNPHQRLALICSLVVGALLSVKYYSEGAPFNAVCTIIPTAVTLGLHTATLSWVVRTRYFPTYMDDLCQRLMESLETPRPRRASTLTLESQE